MMDSPFRRGTVIALLALLTAVPFTFAAEPHPAVAPKAPLRPATQALPALIVPNVRGQAYVFAEGALEDAGLAWHVDSGNGFSANTVVAQWPKPGTRLVNTGAPLVTLTLGRNRGYPQHGSPENKSPYRGTAVRLAAS
jgi:hypothetical protein